MFYRKRPCRWKTEFIVTKNLSDRAFLFATISGFGISAIFAFLIQSGLIGFVPGDLAGYFFTMQFCVIVSAYFAVFESWKVTSDIAIKEMEISGSSVAYDIGSKSNLYSIATLMALMVSVWVLPFFFIYSQYGTVFLILFGIHSLSTFIFWSYFGRGRTLATLDWGRYKVSMGVIFFIILVFTSFYNPPPSSPVFGGFVNWTGFSVLFAIVTFTTGQLFLGINNKPKNLLLFFTKRINFLRLLGLLSLLGCAILLVVKENYTQDSAVYYKGEQAFIFYGVCILLCSIAELIYSLGKPNLMSTSIKNIFAFLILIRAITSFLITLAVFLPSLYSGKDLLNSFLPAIPFFLSAAGGFALNDYFDIEKDLINKPYRAIPSGAFSPRFVLPFSIISLILGFLSAAILSHNGTEFTLYILCISGVAFYNVFVRYVSLSKTFLTSAVSALPILFSVIVFEYPDVYIFLPIAACFFILGREWLMDIRDLNGDLAGRTITIPMKIGTAITARLGFAFQIAAILLLLPIVIYSWSYLSFSLFATALFSVAVLAPLWWYHSGILRQRVIQLLWLPMFFGLLLFIK